MRLQLSINLKKNRTPHPRRKSEFFQFPRLPGFDRSGKFVEESGGAGTKSLTAGRGYALRRGLERLLAGVAALL